MILGIDFDNTIVCYDRTVYQYALSKGLIPASVLPVKNRIREYLREAGQEDVWTELQGEVYGRGLDEASPFPGVIDFFHRCHDVNLPVYIISHKTKYPYRGTQYDLHEAANNWIKKHDLFSTSDSKASRNIFLELTKEEKIQRVKKQKCTHFIDDLPEFLSEPSFPRDVHRILFDPHNLHPDADVDTHISSWPELATWVFSRISV